MDIYTDGGVIARNPSVIGGTWAWVGVSLTIDKEGIVCDSASGVVTPKMAMIESISNNYTELLAAVEAMESVMTGWKGTLYTDSLVTLRRLVGRRPKMNGIPAILQARFAAAKARCGAFRVVLVKGHPTKVDLECGVSPGGLPVSKWNVHCDAECTRMAKEYLENFHAK